MIQMYQIEPVENALIVLQASSLCNLNCSYCYVPDRLNSTRMSYELLEESIFKVFNSSFFRKKLMFLWHAGEPLVVGIDYYKHAVKTIELLSTMPYSLELQTNATLVNQKWIDFFSEKEFNLGVSIDGPAFLHDESRKNWANKNTHAKTLKGLRLIRDAKLDFGVICVLTKKSLDYPDEIFDFFNNEGVNSISFNLEEKDGDNQYSTVFDDQSTSSMLNKYRVFIDRMYERWEETGRKIHFREIFRTKNSINRVLNDPHYLPLSQEIRPFAIVTIARNGDITLFSPELAGGIPSDRRKFVIANIKDINTLDDITQLQTFHDIYNPIKEGYDLCSRTCEHFLLCGGGSPSNKYAENNTFASSETKYCIFQQKMLADLYIEKMSHKTNLTRE